MIEILAREEDLDRGFAAHNRSFATKKSTLWHPGYFLGQLLIAPPLMSSRRVIGKIPHPNAHIEFLRYSEISYLDQVL